MYLLPSSDARPDGSQGSAAGGGRSRRTRSAPRVQLLGSGTILREVEAAGQLLADDFGVAADVWSCPSFNELGRDTVEVDRWNRLHPGGERRTAWVTRQLAGRPPGPVVAATDYVRAFAE